MCYSVSVIMMNGAGLTRFRCDMTETGCGSGFRVAAGVSVEANKLINGMSFPSSYTSVDRLLKIFISVGGLCGSVLAL